MSTPRSKTQRGKQPPEDMARRPRAPRRRRCAEYDQAGMQAAGRPLVMDVNLTSGNLA